VLAHLDVIDLHHSLIRKTLREQLCYNPDWPTRNRKALAQPAPSGAAWELRFGPDNRFRVFYEIDTEEHAVCILAIGEKTGNRLYFGGEEYLP
jgi:mRNA-degrading endonuclease RelE of RelBE toxin-antitoxin system